MTDIETVIERVNRLMAIAEDDAASDNEIELAYGRAQRLIDKYRIEDWRRDPMSREQAIIERDVRISKDMQSVHLALAQTIAGANDCHAFRMHRKGQADKMYVSFIGMKNDVEASVLLYENMQMYIAKRSRVAYRDLIGDATEKFTGKLIGEYAGSGVSPEYIRSYVKSYVTRSWPRRRFYIGYRIGFIERVKERLDEARTVMLNIPTGRDLTACKRERVDEFIKRNIEPNAKHFASYKLRVRPGHAEGYTKGLADGGEVAIGLGEVDAGTRETLAA